MAHGRPLPQGSSECGHCGHSCGHCGQRKYCWRSSFFFFQVHSLPANGRPGAAPGRTASRPRPAWSRSWSPAGREPGLAGRPHRPLDAGRLRRPRLRQRPGRARASTGRRSSPASTPAPARSSGSTGSTSTSPTVPFNRVGWASVVGDPGDGLPLRPGRGRPAGGLRPRRQGGLVALADRGARLLLRLRRPHAHADGRRGPRWCSPSSTRAGASRARRATARSPSTRGPASCSGSRPPAAQPYDLNTRRRRWWR